jgi:hypothetical protein
MTPDVEKAGLWSEGRAIWSQWRQAVRGLAAHPPPATIHVIVEKVRASMCRAISAKFLADLKGEKLSQLCYRWRRRGDWRGRRGASRLDRGEPR